MSTRSRWRGAVCCDLVSIAVKLFVGTENRSVPFHQEKAEDGGRRQVEHRAIVDGLSFPTGTSPRAPRS